MKNMFGEKLPQIQKKDRRYLGIMAVISFLYLLLAYESTSPLYPYVHGLDSSFFMVTGRMVADGKVPYLDFFDMKGPIIFFIEGLGEWLIDGKMGIFLIQNLFFLATTGLSYGIARQFVKEGPALLVVLLNLFVLSTTSSGGNFTEEFSLPPVLLCELLAVLYAKKSKKSMWKSGETEHPPFYAAVYGFCFMYLALIRITNAALICGIVGSVLVVLIATKKWKNIVQNMAGFLIGAALCFAPVALYFLAKNAFGEMLYGTFVFPFMYSNDGITNRAASTWMSILYYIGPALSGFFAALIYGKKKEPYMGYMMAFSIFLLVVSLNMGRTSAHYFTLAMPSYVVGLAMTGQLLSERELRTAPWPLFLTAALVAVLGSTFMNYHGGITAKISSNLNVIVSPEGGREWTEAVRAQGDLIPEAERDLVWGYGIHPAWYFINDIQPCNRFCAYQGTFVSMAPEKTVDEIYTMLDTVFPRWIIVYNVEEAKGELEYLGAVLETRYKLVSDLEEFDLYQLRQ